METSKRITDYFVQLCVNKFKYHYDMDNILEKYTKMYSRRYKKPITSTSGP